MAQAPINLLISLECKNPRNLHGRGNKIQMPMTGQYESLASLMVADIAHFSDLPTSKNAQEQQISIIQNAVSSQK